MLELPFGRRMSDASRWLERLLLLSFVVLQVVSDVGRSFADSSPALNPGTLTATGRVVLPDGSPATNAVVSAISGDAVRSTSVLADAEGRFQLRRVFGNYCGIHAHTPDWRQQASLWIPGNRARTVLEQPLELKLLPAREQNVLVKSAGKPVPGVAVIATGQSFEVGGTTGPDGVARLWLPQGRDWASIDAWDPKLGGARKSSYGPSRPTGVVELSLLAPVPATIRVVDDRMNPMRNLQIAVDCSSPSGGVSAHEFDAASVRTDSHGEVTIPWLPADLSYVHLEPLGAPWKVDEIYMHSGPAHDQAIAQIRRRRPVTGRLIMPPGASPEGILVSGNAFGGGGTGDCPYARVRRDGTFTFLAASDHGYALGISDDKWACDVWTGVVLTSDAAEPAQITLHAYPAIPLTVHTTWGPKSEPWTNLYLHARQEKSFDWTNSRGERQSGGGGIDNLGQIDATGTARFGVGHGDYELYLHWGAWSETRKLKIASDQPVSVTLHRPWKEYRELAGRLTLNGSLYRPTSATTLRAWSVERSAFATPAKAKVLADGRFTASAETKCVCLYATDRVNRLNAFHLIDQAVLTAGLELALVPTGVYSGQVVDEDGKPVAGSRVRLVPQATDVETGTGDALLDEAECDNQGRFRFENAPTGVIVWPLIVTPSRDWRPPTEWRWAAKTFRLLPGGRHEGERIQVMIGDYEEPEPPVIRQYASAADHLADLIHDARILNLRVLIGAMGDATGAMDETWQQLMDKDETKESLRYLPFWIAAGDLRVQSDLFSQLKLRPPKSGEMLLAVLDGNERQVAFLYLTVRDSSSISRLAMNFLKKHAPPARDAQKLVAAAQSRARATGRRVWIVGASSRLERSFRLVRWLESQHALLDRDYVFVNLIEGCEEKVDEVWNSLHLDDGNEPWFAITDAAGKVLAKSDTPHGQILFPDSADAKRHFRSVLQKTVQKLTPADIDRLMQSLGE